MHQIQPNGSIKEKYNCEHETQTEAKQKRSIQKDEARRNTEAKKKTTLQ